MCKICFDALYLDRRNMVFSEDDASALCGVFQHHDFKAFPQLIFCREINMKRQKQT